jgi:nucleoid DNA-binding protein
MNTTEVIITLARKLNISQAAARTLLRERLTGFGKALMAQETVDLPGLGTIEVQQIKERRQYIPGKYGFCIVPSHKRPAFKIDNFFKARLRRKGH